MLGGAPAAANPLPLPAAPAAAAAPPVPGPAAVAGELCSSSRAIGDAGADGEDDAVDAASNDVAEGWAQISAKVLLEDCGLLQVPRPMRTVTILPKECRDSPS